MSSDANNSMSSERWQRISDLFAEASVLQPVEQDAFLSEQCGSDQMLRQEVESLLVHARPEDSLFGDVPPQTTVREGNCNFADWVGCRLGRYRLKQLLSSGGMGVVFLAEQDQPNRKVAIKLLHRGTLFGSAMRRFEFEAEILGRLRHPCVAEIYEADRASLMPAPTNGPTAPMHYFAMEYIDGGQTLLEYVANNALTLRQKLSLFVQICDGIHHGHQKGVIHRDLKPSNIMVTDVERASGQHSWLPKIIDFGVAKCTDADVAVTTMQTATGELIGTLQYMSPEQCGTDVLAIDTRADVYALGVILFQLMTGRVPYDLSNLTIQSAARVIAEKEAEPASRFDRRLRGDVETIIAKALSKEREHRYESAAALSHDVERYLNGESISARQPTRWVRSMRWITRHPRWASLFGSLFISIAIVGSTSALVWMGRRVPYRIQLTDLGSRYDAETGMEAESGDRVSLYSISGNELHAWTSGEDGIRLAAQLERPQKWGGGSIAIIGFSNHADNVAYRNRICIFEVNEPQKPDCMMGIDSAAVDAMPQDAWPRPTKDLDRQYTPRQFFLYRGWIEDVFDDDNNPGHEVISFWMHESGSQGLLQISNLAGEALFWCWQDGGINDIYWMSAPRVLVCAGIRGDRFEWGFGVDLKGNHPGVLFAIKPDVGRKSNGWILPEAPDPIAHPRFEGDQWNGEQFRPEWYKTICPLRWASIGDVQLVLSPTFTSGFDPTETAQVVFMFKHVKDASNGPYMLMLEIDADGEVINRPMEANAVHSAQARDPTLPTRTEIDLVNWDDVLSACERSASDNPSSIE